MRKLLLIIVSITGLIYFDYFSKWLFSGVYQSLIIECPILYHPDCLWKYYPIVGELIGIQLSHNSGIAFSLPITGLPLQIITIILVSGLLGYYFYTEYPKKSKLLDIGYILIIAGALSHAYERIYNGYVVDFISIKYFAILNFADIFITIGACFIFFVYYVRKQ